MLVSKRKVQFTGRKILGGIIAIIAVFIMAFLTGTGVVRDIKAKAPLHVTVASRLEGQQVVFRGATVDGVWYNPADLIQSAEGWEYEATTNTYFTTHQVEMILNLPKGSDRILVFNTGEGQGNISIEIAGQITEYTLSNYAASDVGTPFPVANSEATGDQIAKVRNYSGFILVCAYTVLLVGLIVFFSDNKAPKRTKSKRNSAIELLRFVIIMSVVVHHYCPISPNGYLGVDFFFVLSGFLLMSHFVARYQPEQDAITQAISYTKNKYLKLIPYYLLAFMLSILLSVAMNKGLTVGSFVKSAVWELSMMEGFGITQNLLVGPGWYCSSLLIAGFVIYFLLGKFQKNYVFFIAPLSFMIVFTYMALNFGNLNRWMQVDTCISTGTLRGFAEMGLGCMCYQFFDYARDKLKNRMKVISSIIELLCISFILYVMYGKNAQGYDFVCVLVMSTLITSFFIANSYLSKLLSNPISQYLGKISVSIYLNHIIISYVDWYALIGINWYYTFFLYLCIVVCFSCVSNKCIELITQSLNKSIILKQS